MKPWEKPQLIKQEDRWVVVVPVDDRTSRNYDVTQDVRGWINREVEAEFDAISGEVKANGDLLLHWVQNHPNPPGINLYSLGNWLLNLAAAIKKR